ncbi:MAG: PLP-dependent cysteine synthase family protein [Chlorobi bacterium]|nr:PLP-dependent cysteine synthase family protein [Chlorobiota bacterium]
MYDNILQSIGDTPLVKINKLNTNPGVEIYAKTEGQNPGGSIKDRVALKMIEQAEAEGSLTKNKTIIEATSGNTGIALAMIAAVKNYKLLIVMSESVSTERRKIIKAFGADIILTPAAGGTDAAILKVKEICKKNPGKYFTPDQFSNRYNKIAHYKLTAEEIWKQTNGNIDYFVSSVGTSGTIMGVGKALKENNPKIKIVEAHPAEGHYIQGLKNMKEAIIPAIYNPEIIDKRITVETEDAFKTARKIIAQEGIFAGMSSGAAMYAALKIAEETDKGRIVVIFPDRAEKYLSTKLFEQ